MRKKKLRKPSYAYAFTLRSQRNHSLGGQNEQAPLGPITKLIRSHPSLSFFPLAVPKSFGQKKESRISNTISNKSHLHLLIPLRCPPYNHKGGEPHSRIPPHATKCHRRHRTPPHRQRRRQLTATADAQATTAVALAAVAAVATAAAAMVAAAGAATVLTPVGATTTAQWRQ
jgi:hypothetical protein